MASYQRSGIQAEVLRDGETGTRTAGQRYRDTRATIDTGNPEHRIVIEDEVKVGRVSNSSRVDARIDIEIKADVAELAQNQGLRDTGTRLKSAGRWLGRAAKPVGLVLDGLELKRSFSADGGTVGRNTQRSAAGIAAGAVRWLPDLPMTLWPNEKGSRTCR